jgi:dihydroxyacetone kinase-like protein
MISVDSKTIAVMLSEAAKTMSAHRAELIELDSAIGDGDLGITMEKGFAAAARSAETNIASDPGTILMKAGMDINKNAPSTMGTLMATGFMRGGKAVAGKPDLDARDLITFMEAFLQGVIDRGKAKPGDKTIIDVLIPAIDGMKAAEIVDVSSALKAAKEGAEKGLEYSKTLIAQHGRASIFREKTQGLIDPGGQALVLMIESFYKASVPG